MVTVIPKSSQVKPETAAESALRNVEGNKASAEELLNRLVSVASRLGQNQDSSNESVPKCVPAGIIGQINDVSRDVGNLLQECFSIINSIETQV